MPAHCLFFRTSIDDRFVVCAVLPHRNLARVFSCFAPGLRRTEARSADAGHLRLADVGPM
jgi:hypothetical protein